MVRRVQFYGSPVIPFLIRHYDDHSAVGCEDSAPLGERCNKIDVVLQIVPCDNRGECVVREW